MVFLYEEIWEQPIPETHAPPQNIPARKKLSPKPEWWTYLLVFGAGVFIGLPIGREILKTLAGMTEEEIRRRLEETQRRRGL